MYLTYEEFINMSGTLDEAIYNDYDNLEFEARAFIDWYTFNRLQNESTYPEAVKRCMCKLIMLIRDKQQATMIGSQSADGLKKAGIVAESNDGVSTTYNTLSANEAAKLIKNNLESTVRMYLHGVRNSLGHKLLYRGVYANE